MPHRTASDSRRYLDTLQRLLEMTATDLEAALAQAADTIANVLGADKVDAFLYDAARDSLVAVGTSAQPLSALERQLGLDVLPLSNGGRTADVFRSGRLYQCGNVRADEGELRGIREGLHVRSLIAAPLEAGGQRRGVLLVSSLQPNFFSPVDATLVASAARWIASVAERAELVESIRRTAVEQTRRRTADELVSVVAHDIRNYLQPITWRLQALEGGLDALSLQPVDLVALVRTAAAACASPDHPTNVSHAQPVAIAADPVRLRQCLDNVLANAMTHSPAGAPVHVFVSRTKARDGAWARVEIVDEGPGVPEAFVPHVFEKFFSGSAEGRGVGLGLYVAKRIAAAHGGDLGVDRYEGKGARFTLRIPALP